MKKKDELQLPAQLNEVVEQYKPEDLTKAQKIASNYAPFMEAVNDQMEDLKKLEKGNEEHLPKARRIRLDLGKICSAATKQKAIDKESILLQQRFVDALFNTVNGAARITQGEAEEMEKHFELVEQKRLEKLQEKRVELLSIYLPDAHERKLSEMDEDVWEAYLGAKKKDHEDRIAAEKKAEEDRIAKEKEEEAERERIRLENIELKKAQEAKEKQLQIEAYERQKAEEKRKAKEEDDRKKRESELAKERELQEKKLQEERDAKAKLQLELQKKEEAEAKAKADEEDRIQAELNKGDAAKVKDLISDLSELKTKYQFKSSKNKKSYQDVGVLIDKVIAHIQK